MATLDDLERIAAVEFADIVKSTDFQEFKLRIGLCDNSFVDVHLSRKLSEKFGFHWESRGTSRESRGTSMKL